MNGLTFEIELLEPLLIGQFRAGDENSETSFNYIPGSSLRGMFIQRFTHTGEQIIHEPDALGYRLFFDGAVCYLNAYPTNPKGVRTLPTPRSLYGDEDMVKNGDELARDDNSMILDSTFATIDELEKLERLKSPFCHLGGGKVALYSAKRRIGVHNASTERFVKKSNDSTVFRYDALEAGQTFSCAVICEDKSLLEAHLRPLLDEPDCFLGRSRSAGYGRVRIVNADIDDAWQEYQPSVSSIDGLLTLTLLSDAILRDSAGQYTLDLPTGCSWQFSPEHAFGATETIGSFNRTWGLPTQQVPSLSAGSILYFENRPEIAEALAKCAQNGIGERRNEGYGRVAVNWLSHKVYKLENESPDEKSKVAIALNDTDRKMAASMVHRLLRRQLDIQLTAQVNEDGLQITNQPENSPLSRLRLVVRDAWRKNDPDLLPRFLDDLRQNARTQYQKAKVGEDKSLYNWLKNGWLDPLWKESFVDAAANTPAIGDVSFSANNELNGDEFQLAALKLEYVARLVDGLCNKAIKKKQFDESQANQENRAHEEGQVTEIVQ